MNRNKIFIQKIIIWLSLTIPVIFFFARLFYPQPSIFMIPDFGLSDVLHGNFPAKEIVASFLKAKEWPLWTQYLSSGFPLLAEGQSGVFYLPNLFLFRFLPTITAYNLNLAISFLLISAGTYILFRSFFFSKVASIFGAYVFTFCGYFSVHLNHFELLQTASLMPLLLYSSIRIWRKPNILNSILFGFILSQQIFAGYLNTTFISLVGVFLLLVGLYITTTQKLMASNLIKRVCFFTLAFTIACAFSAIQLLPTIEIWRFSAKDSGVSFETVTSFPYPVKHLLSFINPYIFGNPSLGTYPKFGTDWGIFWENTAYLGLLPLFLAVISLRFVKIKIIKTALFMLIISLLLVFGKYSPLYFIFSFPPFNFFRVPSKYLMLTAFSLTLLSTVMFEEILKIVGRTTRKRLVYFVIIFAVFIGVFTDEYRFSYNYPPATSVESWTNPPQIVQILPEKNERVMSIGSFIPWNEIFLKKGWADMSPYSFFRNSLQPNYNIFFSIPHADGYMGGLVPKRISLLQEYLKQVEFDLDNKTATVSNITKNLYSLYSIRYIISSQIISNKNAYNQIAQIKPPETLRNLSSYYIYENPTSLPRSYLAFNTTKVITLEDLIRNLSDDKFVQKRTILVEDDALLLNQSKEATGSVDLLFSSNTNYLLKTQANVPAILVLTDNYYPGWTAAIDDKSTNIYQVNLSQKGIYVPQGSHVVSFSYKPRSFEIGKSITIASYIIISLTVFLRHVSFPGISYRKFPPFLYPRNNPGN